MKRRKELHKIISLVLVVFVLSIIFGFSNEVGVQSASTSSKVLDSILGIISGLYNYDIKAALDIRTYTIFHDLVRKAAHIFIYMVLSMSFLYLFTSWSKKNHYRNTLIASLLVAISDEIHQLFILGRSGKVLDIFVDMTGVCIGLLVFYLLQCVLFTEKTKKKEQKAKAKRG